MKFFFDDLVLVPDKDNVIVYSPCTHAMVRVNKESIQIIQNIILIGSGCEFEIKELLKGYDFDKALTMLNILEHNKIFSRSKEEFESRKFINKYLKLKKHIRIKIAYLHITQRCNLDCIYCYNKSNLNKSDEMNTEQWKVAIDRLVEIGISRFIFTGGEPLIRSDLNELISYASQFASISVLTNGTLLNKVSNDFYENVSNIVISLDSIDLKTNSSTRINSDKYGVFNNLLNIPKKYSSKISIRSVITNNNIDEIEKTKTYVENKLGFKYITSIFLPNNYNEVGLVPEIQFFDPDESDKNLFGNIIVNCGGCIKEIALDSNGDIYPCQSLIKEEFIITNILSPGWYQELLYSKITKVFKELNVTKIPKCKDCKYMYICGGGCRAIAYNVYGKIDSHIDYFCDFLEREAIFRLKQIYFKSNNCIK